MKKTYQNKIIWEIKCLFYPLTYEINNASLPLLSPPAEVYLHLLIKLSVNVTTMKSQVYSFIKTSCTQVIHEQ